jgi:sec-independent protein translocase protein TatB
MLNFGWAELLVIGVVALIVIGPEDLPDMFRQLGRFTAKLRTMSREFSRAMEQAAKESGVKDVAADLKSVTSAKSLGLDAVKSAADKFEKWDPIKNAAKPTVASAVGAKPLVPPPMPASPKPSVLEDQAEADEDMADHDAPEPAAAGVATQALYDKKALRAQVMAEQTAKLKAIDAGTYAPEPVILPPAKTAVAKTAVAKTAVAKTAVAKTAVAKTAGSKAAAAAPVAAKPARTTRAKAADPATAPSQPAPKPRRATAKKAEQA